MNHKLSPSSVVLILCVSCAPLSVWDEGRLGAAYTNGGDPINGRRLVRPASGPLKVHLSNPRYFTDRSGSAVYLTGSHTHQNFQDRPKNRQGVDYLSYLEFLQQHNHNFIRLWTWEDTGSAPLPYQRTGPGMALDGDRKFDMTQFNQVYFDQLRSRVMAAYERGMYVSIMLFQGWSIEDKTLTRTVWRQHPFNKDNNINGINGDPDGDGQGIETHSLWDPAITAVQEAYIRKVIDTVNDLDNVLYEVTNETRGGPTNTEWQYYVINFIKGYEAKKSKQHPVGMTVEWPDGDNSKLFASPADWISPNHTEAEPYKDDPPAAVGNKIIVNDTDHLWGAGGNLGWVWKSFMRGLHPIFMDVAQPWGAWDIPDAERVRWALGETKSYTNKMNLADMVPRVDLASTGYCLANPGKEYLVYASSGTLFHVFSRRTIIVDLTGTCGVLNVEWFDPNTATIVAAGTIRGGNREELTVPFRADAVLHLSMEKTSGVETSDGRSGCL